MFQFLSICLSLLLTACAVNKDSLKAVIAENPEIVFDAVEKNPGKFMEVMQKVQLEGRKLAQEEEEKREKAEREEEIKNPKKPEIQSNRAIQGSRNAPIQVVEYSDFQCPYCARGYQTVEQLKKKYGEKMMFVFKHLPLSFHPLAMPAAQHFEAIALQSAEKAYKFHDEIFKNQQKFSTEGVKFMEKVATKLGVNIAKMKTDLESDEVKNRIKADIEEANRFGIQGTPGFVVNGSTLKGAYPVASFEEILQARGLASK